MSRLRTPVVIGLHSRSGASTVAAALHADEGCERECGADVVCVGEHALSRAHVLATPMAGPRPVLAVGAGPACTGAPLHALGARFGAVVLLPHLPRWAGVPAPCEEIALLLGLSAHHLPPPLRAYAAAMRDVAAAVVASGLLTWGSPPTVLPPRASTFPVPPVRPVRLGSPDLDGVLEAAGIGATRRASG